MRSPIETVVIRELVRVTRAEPAHTESALPEPDELVEPARGEPAEPVQFSPDQQRDLGTLAELVRCPVRQAILLALACGGETNVGGLAGRTSIPQKTITHHLHDLRSAGFVVSRRRGKQVFNALAARRFHFQRRGADCFALTLAAWGGNTRLKVEIGPEPEESDPAPHVPPAVAAAAADVAAAARTEASGTARPEPAEE